MKKKKVKKKKRCKTQTFNSRVWVSVRTDDNGILEVSQKRQRGVVCILRFMPFMPFNTMGARPLVGVLNFRIRRADRMSNFFFSTTGTR